MILFAVPAAMTLAACNPAAETNNPAVATDEAVAERQAEAPAAGASSFTEEQAREHLMSRGYTNPSALTRTADGGWQGTASMGPDTYNVLIDYQGNIVRTSGAGSMSGTGTGATGSGPGGATGTAPGNMGTGGNAAPKGSDTQNQTTPPRQ
jgi:hypothetical protein